MVGIESLILYSSVYVAGLVLFGNLEDFERLTGPIAPKALIVAAVILVNFIAMGLYHFHQRIYFREAVIRIVVGIAAGCVILAAISYVLPTLMISSNIAAIAVAYALVLLLVVRYCFVMTVDENVFRHRTVVYGAGERASSITGLRRRADRRGFVIVGTVSAPGDTIVGEKSLFTNDGVSIADFALEKGADEIVVAMDDRRGNLPVRELLDAKLRGINVVDLMEFLERETGKIRIDLVNPGWLIFSTGFRTSRFRVISKRLVDIIVSATLLLVSLPIILLIALAIIMEDGIRSPVLYRQRRVGRGHELFSVLKFRSMGIDAESDGKAVWATAGEDRKSVV